MIARLSDWLKGSVGLFVCGLVGLIVLFFLLTGYIG